MTRGGSGRAEERALELGRLEAERPLAALEGDPSVGADEVEAVGPAAVGGSDEVVDAVDDRRHLDVQARGAARGNRETLLDGRRFVHGHARAAVLRQDPPLLRVRLADVDQQEPGPAVEAAGEL